MGDRYHKAARDGLCEVLKEASKKEINAKDNDGMTPVLWAAFEGKLDALRFLVARGGDVDKTDQFGNSALHLASAKGHFACVDFLVKFGANIFSLDIDNHNPQQLAAINNREDILRYLDAAAANLESTDKKKANAFKEKARKASEKRIKEFMKRQQKSEEQKAEAEKSSKLKAMKYKFWTGSHGNLSKIKDSNFQQDTKFSALVGSGTMVQRGAAQRKIQALKQTRQANMGAETENGGRSVRSIEGVQRESEVLYVGTFHNNSNTNSSDRRGRIVDVFEYESNSSEGDRRNFKHASISRCLSQPDLLAPSPDMHDDIRSQRSAGIYDRPSLHDTLSIPQSVATALSLQDQVSNHSSNDSGSAKKQNSKKSRQRQRVISDSDDSDGTQNSSDESEEPNLPLKRFLAAYSLEEYFELLLKHQIDLETLMLLTDEDLKYLNLPLGPYRKLSVAIQERKSAFNNPGPMNDSRL